MQLSYIWNTLFIKKNIFGDGDCCLGESQGSKVEK